MASPTVTLITWTNTPLKVVHPPKVTNLSGGYFDVAARFLTTEGIIRLDFALKYRVHPGGCNHS